MGPAFQQDRRVSEQVRNVARQAVPPLPGVIRGKRGRDMSHHGSVVSGPGAEQHGQHPGRGRAAQTKARPQRWPFQMRRVGIETTQGCHVSSVAQHLRKL